MWRRKADGLRSWSDLQTNWHRRRYRGEHQVRRSGTLSVFNFNVTVSFTRSYLYMYLRGSWGRTEVCIFRVRRIYTTSVDRLQPNLEQIFGLSGSIHALFGNLRYPLIHFWPLFFKPILTLPFLADRTNGRAYATVLRLSVCLSSVRYVWWLNGAS